MEEDEDLEDAGDALMSATRSTDGKTCVNCDIVMCRPRSGSHIELEYEEEKEDPLLEEN